MNKTKIVSLGLINFFLLSLFGCASAPKTAVNDIWQFRGGFSCKSPYNLVQDCSKFTGAKRKVEINGYKMKISGSANGKFILLMGQVSASSVLLTGLSLGLKNYITEKNDKCLNVVKDLYSENDIKILKIVALSDVGAIVGFLMELDKDGYSILKSRTI